MGWVVALQMVYTPKEHYFAFTDSAALPVPTTTLMAPRSAGPQLFQASQARQKQEKVFAGGRTRVQPGLARRRAAGDERNGRGGGHGGAELKV